MRVTLPLVAMLTACDGTETSVDEGTNIPIGAPVVDTDWPVSDRAQFFISEDVNMGAISAYAIASDNQPDFPNVAQCIARGSHCFPTIPVTTGELGGIDYDTTTGSAPSDMIRDRYLGLRTQVANLPLDFFRTPRDILEPIGFYFGRFPASELERGPAGVSWEGEWEPYVGVDDLEVLPPIQILSPPQGTRVAFVNSDFVEIEWVPTGEGFVTLSVEAAFGFARLMAVEDDGYHALDVSALNIRPEIDVENFVISLSRWSTNEIDRFGHQIDLAHVSTTSFLGTYVNVGSRDPIAMAETCTQARGLPPLETGAYWGSFAGFDDGFTDFQGVTDFSPCEDNGGLEYDGPDGLMRVVLNPNSKVSLVFNSISGDPTIGLSSDCSSSGGDCLVDSDEVGAANVPESVEFTNLTERVREIYVELNTEDPSLYTLDVDKADILPAPTFDACFDADSSETLIDTGCYFIDSVSQFTASSNPGVGGCTGTSLPGQEALIPIEIPPQTTATFDVEAQDPTANPAVYLLSNCADEFTCVAGNDENLNARERLLYENTTGVAERLTLVVDSSDSLAPFLLTITFD